jgi:hypothetical protein
MQLLSAIRMSGNGPFGSILVFLTFFEFLLGHNLNDFENIFNMFLVFFNS